ncbi:glycosyltransferase family 2 protein [Mesorhizobium sp.]|uniref:glycosyltransferase family 2 protein n=1 Tax=Mesorhizobium sp. TaxID=1871066 RepID=UPI000FE32D33|nr:glycosyltransferase family 2 protein [Mesorhizobium sp.]RWP27948.1 MAG: glycosyltransferase family 2 protein [Mesorhizobium sp.]RWP69434.1 MAG: glycosyltransferase family 2 protein [Mesorhizobium sp.]RWQ14449.1 MAG: glycosyltransferase family 2 protein [Mesorhizobium sp.]
MIEYDGSGTGRLDRPVLSVCIPTFNRRDAVTELVQRLLEAESRLQVCVHVDGSTDGTCEALNEIASSETRLVVTHSQNKGRASAMFSAIRSATGEYAMIFDDDDECFTNNLPMIVDLLVGPAAREDKIAGFVFSMVISDERANANSFPTARSNLIKIRADERVVGDKKEIIKTRLLKLAATPPAGNFRRVPTSLLWSRIALQYDVNCVNIDIGRKRYLPDGMSAKIRQLQRENPYPIFLLNCNYIRAFFLGRYFSKKFLSKAVISSAIFLSLSVPVFLRKSVSSFSS